MTSFFNRTPTGFFSRLVIPVLLLLAVGLSARAETASGGIEEEGLGDLSVSDFFLEPTYSYSEPHRGEFRAGSSYIAATWRRDATISGTIKVGGKELLGLPARYGLAPSGEIGLLEAFAQADSGFGRFRLGLVPIPFGLEGGDAERRLRFPRSLIFQTRFVNLRDYGIAYRIAHEGFFSEWAIHNGEGGPDLDNEAWFTARWGWQGAHFVRAGFSGSTGRTNPRSTDPQGLGNAGASDALNKANTAAGLDINKMAKVVIANGFVQWDVKPVRLSLEATAGDTRQDETVIKYRALHADVEVEGGSSTVWLARYDTLDPRSDVSGDQITEYTVGVGWRSRYENSTLYLFGTKRIQQDVSQDLHRAMVIWRLTPSVSSLDSAL